jgi:hypothetical protein
MEIKELMNTMIERTLVLNKKKRCIQERFDGLPRPSSDSQSHPSTLTCDRTCLEILADTKSSYRGTC